MASRVEYAVSCTPIVTVAAATESPTYDALCVDVAKQLGSSGSVAVTWGTTVGYAAGSPAYVTSGTAAYTAGQTAVSLGTFTSTKFVYIKHSGYLYSSSSVLGAATTLKLKICMAATIADATTIAVLNPGDSIILPFNTAVTPVFYAASETASNAIAVIVMGTP
jgi:hypothetical protein